MTDIVATVPKGKWQDWIEEGDLPGSEWSMNESHFWLQHLPDVKPGDRLYIVAHGRLRGFAPVVRTERYCILRNDVSCVVRRGGAVAMTIEESIKGFVGWRYRHWDRFEEGPFPDWKTADVG